jgi:hypothetical protein
VIVQRRRLVLALAALLTVMAALPAADAYAAGRKGSRRVGGSKTGKGSRYVGGRK